MKSDTHSLELSESVYQYQIVHSKRAKHIRIKLSNTGILRLVLPAGTSEKLGHTFIKSKSTWVERSLDKLTISQPEAIPELLNLRLLNEIWTIDYIDHGSNKILLKESHGLKLTISGDSSDTSQLYKAINHWCKKKSKLVFKPMLEQLAEEHGFHYNGLTIRAQKTRWGSCSSKKNINLNCKLLFMPIEVVKYVMIHELCHTLEMNHSSRFWSLVADCDPDFKENRKQLKRLGKQLFL